MQQPGGRRPGPGTPHAQAVARSPAEDRGTILQPADGFRHALSATRCCKSSQQVGALVGRAAAVAHLPPGRSVRWPRLTAQTGFRSCCTLLLSFGGRRARTTWMPCPPVGCGLAKPSNPSGRSQAADAAGTRRGRTKPEVPHFNGPQRFRARRQRRSQHRLLVAGVPMPISTAPWPGAAHAAQ